MPETAEFCPGCGRAIGTAQRANAAVGALPENVIGALAYCTFIPAIIFLVIEPYSKNRFVRYHSIQCLLFWAALAVIAAAVKVVGFVLALVPIVGQLVVVLIGVVVAIAAFLVWLVLVVKALQGEMFRLPVLGDLAERYASAT
jgi:uncharacterized membrane protein